MKKTRIYRCPSGLPTLLFQVKRPHSKKSNTASLKNTWCTRTVERIVANYCLSVRFGKVHCANMAPRTMAVVRTG